MPALKELRQHAALSQRDLAKATGIAHGTINRLERGKHKPLPRTIRKLAKALGVQPAEIEF